MMPRSILTSLAFILALLCGVTYARSLVGGRAPHMILNSVLQDQYDYNYGDLIVEYGTPIKRPIGQKTDRGQVAVKEMKQEREERKDKHEVLDDVFNFQYTYGDPDVSYGHYDYDASREEKGFPDPNDLEGDAEDEEHSTRSKDKNKTIITPIVASVIEWVIRNWKDVKHVRNTWVETKDHVKSSLEKVKKSMTRIKSALGGVLVKFGEEAEEGLKYCLVRLQDTSQKINEQGLEAINKLEKLLEEGNEMATSFFRLLGIKLGEIARKYSQGSIFAEDLQLSKYFVFEGTQNHTGRATIPNLFEDDEIIRKLHLMVQQKILNREEVEALLTASAQQTQRATGKMYPDRIQLQKLEKSKTVA